jgi:hypothetical protein
MTHRQYLVWNAWFDEKWNQPSLTDFYLMAIACEVRRVLSKHPGRIKLKDFLLRFGDKEEKPLTVEQATQRSKMVWGSAMTAAQKRGARAVRPAPAAPTDPERMPPLRTGK